MWTWKHLMQWCRARDLFGSPTPVTTEEFELPISCLRSSYLMSSRLGNYFVCNRFAVQTFLWSLEFVIQKNLQRDTILAWNVVWSLNISTFNMINGINESKKLAKHILFKFRYEFGGRKCNLRQKWNTEKCQCECKKLNKISYMWRRLRRES